MAFRKTFIDPVGIERFVPNRIVRDFMDQRVKNMNDVWLNAVAGKYTRQEMREFYQLIGYSIDGYYEMTFEDIARG